MRQGRRPSQTSYNHCGASLHEVLHGPWRRPPASIVRLPPGVATVFFLVALCTVCSLFSMRQSILSLHGCMFACDVSSARALARSRVTAARPRAAAAHAPTAELAPCGASIDRFSSYSTKSYAACTHTRRRPQIRSNNRSFLSRGRRRLDNGVLLIGRRAVRGAVGGAAFCVHVRACCAQRGVREPRSES